MKKRIVVAHLDTTILRYGNLRWKGFSMNIYLLPAVFVDVSHSSSRDYADLHIAWLIFEFTLGVEEVRS